MNNILFDSQKQISDILNADPELSCVNFIPENLKDIEFLITKALKTQGVCGLVMTPTARFQGTSYGKDIVYELPDLTIMITENTPVARSKTDYMTSEDIAVRVADVLGSPASKHFDTFLLIDIQTGEESGLVVSKVRFKCLVQGDLSALPDPRDPSKTIPFALKTDLSAYATVSSVYTKEEIDNKGYITEHQSLSNYYTKSETNGLSTAFREGLTNRPDVSSIVWDDYLTEGGDLVQGHYDVLPVGYTVKKWSGNQSYYQPVDPYGGVVGMAKPSADVIIWEKVTEADVDITATWIAESVTPITEKYAKNNDLSSYATKQYVEDQGFLTAHQSLSDYYTKSEVSSATLVNAALSAKQPSGDYATKSWVEGKNYLTAVPSEYAKTAECDLKYINYKSEKNNIEYNVYNENGQFFFGDEDYDYLVFDIVKMRQERGSNLHPLLNWNNDLTVYVRKGGGVLATESGVSNAISNSLSDYYTKTLIENKGYLTSVPEQYATKTDVSSIVWDDYLTVSGDVIPAHWEVTPSTYSVAIEDDYLIYPTYNGDQCGNTKAMDSSLKTYIWGESEAIEPITATYVEAKTTKKEKYTTSTYVDSLLSDYATKTYVDNIVGDINTILERLN